MYEEYIASLPYSYFRYLSTGFVDHLSRGDGSVTLVTAADGDGASGNAGYIQNFRTNYVKISSVNNFVPGAFNVVFGKSQAKHEV